ncbi:hypothetical protein [Pedobacter miscanthi]|uniref:hypothetical protein n=1 Tax=Pedobacter miscanthi TaxID=2259170 RepID=UPI00292CE593|nr:hypothetical protein [Pedobacter miscanthi]
MENVYRNFYRNFYMRTNGFIPVSPLGQTVYPGDFFQIRNGQMIVLGNIYRNGVIEPQDIEMGFPSFEH